MSYGAQSGPGEKLPRKIYERELAKLDEELVCCRSGSQYGQKVCVVFEGRDGAGKGGTIKAITQRVSPRVFHVVAALTARTEREKSRMYFQRYVPHFPAAGEITIFDHSWFNRTGVERVMGFCTAEEAKRFSGDRP